MARRVRPSSQRIESLDAFKVLLVAGYDDAVIGFGDGSDDGVEAHLSDYLRQSRPDVDLVVYDGGQENYPLFIAVE